MGQKVHPIAFRLGQGFTWSSRWYAPDGEYKELLAWDIKIRKSLMQKLKLAGVTSVEIERSASKVKITIHVSKPGVLIGRGGKGLEELKNFITREFKIDSKNLEIVPMEVKTPALFAQLVAQNVADQVSRRIPPKKVMAQAMERVMGAGAVGARIELSGRLRGAEIARTIWQKEGKVPLQTLKAEIDFAKVDALTKYGIIGVKVWICRKIK